MHESELLSLTERFPTPFYQKHSRFLSFVGRKTLIVYVLHQPVLYGLMSLIALLLPNA